MQLHGLTPLPHLVVGEIATAPAYSGRMSRMNNTGAEPPRSHRNGEPVHLPHPELTSLVSCGAPPHSPGQSPGAANAVEGAGGAAAGGAAAVASVGGFLEGIRRPPASPPARSCSVPLPPPGCMNVSIDLRRGSRPQISLALLKASKRKKDVRTSTILEVGICDEQYNVRHPPPRGWKQQTFLLSHVAGKLSAPSTPGSTSAYLHNEQDKRWRLLHLSEGPIQGRPAMQQQLSTIPEQTACHA